MFEASMILIRVKVYNSLCLSPLLQLTLKSFGGDVG
jgi:hypothetical protein